MELVLVALVEGEELLRVEDYLLGEEVVVMMQPSSYQIMLFKI